MARPVFGSRTMPPGTEALIKTPSGPSSERPRLMVNPPRPGMLNPPRIPRKNTRSSTGVVVSKTPILLPLASSLRIPPTSAASSSPPKSLPLTLTPKDCMSTIGNLPSARRNGSIFTPVIEPANSRPATAGKPSTLTERVIRKRPGSLLKSGHSIPMSLILIGNHFGHMKLSPVAEPTLRKTPKPDLARKLPSPSMAKLRASPPSRSDPIFT